MDRVTMPQLGETVVEGTILQWFKAEGDPIGKDEPLFEVSTDKVDAEVPSAFGGFVRRIVVPEGETVPIGAVVAVIGADLDEPVDLDEEPAPGPAPASEPGPRPDLEPVARSRPRGPDRTTGSAGFVGSGGVGFLSPVVQQLLDDHGLDPATVVGTGRDGRITRADVLASAANRPAAGGGSAATSGSVGAGGVTGPRGGRPPVAPVVPCQPGPDDEIVPFSRARRATAEHMARSKATAAHALVAVDVDYAAIDRVRRPAGLSYLPFVARAVLDGLREFPHLNASVGDDCLIVHPEVHLGLAVDVGGEALMVPVVRSAADRRLRCAGRGLRRRGRPGPGQPADHRRADRRHVHHHQRGLLRHGADARRSSTSRRSPSSPPTASSRGRWPPRAPTASGRSPCTPSATCR